MMYVFALTKTGLCTHTPSLNSPNILKHTQTNPHPITTTKQTTTVKKNKGPPPDPETVEGAKPKEFRDRSMFFDDDRPPLRPQGGRCVAATMMMDAHAFGGGEG